MGQGCGPLLHTELRSRLVSLFVTPSIVWTSRRTRSKSDRPAALMSAIRSQLPFVVWSVRIYGIPRNLRITCVVDFPVTSIRSEEHTSELQSLMRSSYAVFCLTKKKPRQMLNQHNEAPSIYYNN